MENINDRRRADLEYKKIKSSFFKKGILIALTSGILYGLYSAFLTLGMSKGVWINWNAPEGNLSSFAIVFILGTLGAGLNDLFSAIFALIQAGLKGKLGDFFKTLKTKPGLIMIGSALIGGPIAGIAYVIALQKGGSMVIPIAALNGAIGAILGRVLFKQELNKRMMLGIAICILASFLIGATSLGESAPEGLFIGILIALIAAFGWGLEGCVAGFGTSMIDYEIGITIRQCTSAIANLCIIMPILFFIDGGNFATYGSFLSQGITDSSVIFLMISGLFTLFTFAFWYKGNSMCGAALGMACNGTYSFWGPFFCWIVLGIFAGMDGWALAPIAWIAALLMALGILILAVDPLDFFKKKEAK